MQPHEVYENTYVTMSEIESVQRYLGFQHAQINILADLSPELYAKVEQRGFRLSTEPEDIKQAISDFVNIYSAMYKNAQKEVGQELVRGTSSTVVENMGKETNEIVSTSKDKNIAKRFAEAGDSALVHFRVGKGVPFLNVADYKEDNTADEKEIILAPFCQVDAKEEMESFGEFKNYKVYVSQPQLQSRSQEELDALMEEVVQGFAQNEKDIYEYLLLKTRAERFVDSQELQEKGKKIEQFKIKVQNLLKGLCREKEKSINKAREIEQAEKQKQAEEAKRAEEAKIEEENEKKRKEKLSEISSRLGERKESAETLKFQITNNYQKLLEQEASLAEIAQMLGISYTKAASDSRIKDRVNVIKESIQEIQKKLNSIKISENASLEDTAKAHKEIVSLVDSMKMGIEVAAILPEIVNLHAVQSDHEIKENLYLKVQKTIQDAKVQKYLEEKELIENERVGIFGGLSGKRDLQQEKINNINLKLRLARDTTPELKEKYSVREMLADMRAFAKTDLEGELTPEMQNLYTNIKSIFGSLQKGQFSDQYIEQLADSKVMEQKSNSLTVVQPQKTRFFGRNKVQAELLRLQNQELKAKIVEQSQKSKLDIYQRPSEEEDAISLFDSKLKSIDRLTRNKFNHELGKSSVTLELW